MQQPKSSSKKKWKAKKERLNKLLEKRRMLANRASSSQNEWPEVQPDSNKRKSQNQPASRDRNLNLSRETKNRSQDQRKKAKTRTRINRTARNQINDNNFLRRILHKSINYFKSYRTLERFPAYLLLWTLFFLLPRPQGYHYWFHSLLRAPKLRLCSNFLFQHKFGIGLITQVRQEPWENHLWQR